MSGVAAAIGGSAVLGYLGSQSAAGAQENAANNANATQWAMFQQQQQNQKPYLDAGKNALGQIQNNMGYYNQPFTMDQFKQDPGYQFDLQQGQQAIQRSSAVKNGLVSGNQLAALSDYSQNMAQNEFGNAYNRFQNDRSQSFNRLASLAGLGQTGTQNTNAAGANAANNVAQNQIGIGNAQASGIMGGANSISNGVGQWLNYNNQQGLINALNKKNGTLSSLGKE